MKAASGLAFFAFFLVAGSLCAESQGSSDGSWKTWMSQRCWQLQYMAEVHQLSDNQAFFIKNYLAEQGDALDLIEKYGLLSQSAMQAKAGEILDLTREQIGLLLSPEQLRLWSKWDRLFNSKNAAAHRVSDSPPGLLAKPPSAK